MSKAGLGPMEQEIVKKEILHREAIINREVRTKMSIRDFIPLKIIGKGAFGEVRLVRNKNNGEVLALKKMKKTEMINKHQVGHVKAEKEVLSLAQNPWVVELRYSFQVFLYLRIINNLLGQQVPIFGHGISSRRRPNDFADQEGDFIRARK